MQLQFVTEEVDRIATHNPESVKVSAEDAFAVMSRFDEIGVWRAELDSGLVFWTESVFNIYGLEPTSGPVSIVKAIDAYHPDDRDVVLKSLEEASRNKSGFRFVLRLCRPDGEIVWVKSHGLYRESKTSGGELFGYIEKFSPLTRSVTILK